MACLQTLNGLLKDCAASMGGIAEVFLANFDDVTSITLDDTSGKIDAITMASSKKFKKYYFRKETGSMTSTLTNDPANGVSYVQTDLNLVFTKMETTKRIEMSALAVSDLRCIVRDSNGTYWLLGFNEPVNATAGDGQTGTARGDGNRYTLTLQDTSETFPYEILVGTGGVDIDSITD